MGLPISFLESVLHNEKVKPAIADSVELETGETVTIKDLCDFWVEGHKKILETTKIINDARELMKSERKSKEESKVSSEQEMEVVCTSSISKPKRTRRNNKVKTEKV